MKFHQLRVVLPLMISSLAGIALGADSQPGPYGAATTLPIGGAGRWDYITVDSTAKLLYVPRTTHVMVLAEDSGKTIADITGLGGVHGVALVPALNRGFISDGEDGSVVIFDTQSFKIIGKVKAAADADAIIYDPATKRVLVGCGDAGLVMAIDPTVGPSGGAPPLSLDLGGKPEFIAADGAGHAFINVASKDEVVEFDPREMKQLARRSIAPGAKPTSMAIDTEHHRLFIGCRNQMLIILDTESGEVVANLPIGKGVDATAFDDGKILVSCGDGTLRVIAEESADNFTALQTVNTAVGARTLCVDHDTHTVYLPASEMKPADPAKPNARPEPIPDTFKIVVVAPAK